MAGVPERIHLVRIGQGALGEGWPKPDLQTTAGHAMSLNGMMIKASEHGEALKREMTLKVRSSVSSGASEGDSNDVQRG